jgi:oligopeptide/dipeptide ABC transporter ATP-binding protein
MSGGSCPEGCVRPSPDGITGQRTRIVLEGDVPSPASPPSGCRFRTRCWKAEAICATDDPMLTGLGGEHHVACHFPETTPVELTKAPAPAS